ncbi:chromosome segregation SMC family protein [Candidatus Margulisiibacteriota bacterium]
MFLKSLILRGFKTFADPTEIEFQENARVTAVVGPNGCGKSNLLDATRWVLGEDNSRQLRVASLADIIFAGTASRKALSLAEITMVFDNSSGKLPIPFAEVSIKRRTFREGESEFFINKNQCRLKDIKDLLMDTGLGEATYSIITQGQVDAILSSKGEERRAVFEEAAGINKYKYRKLSAEKKLIASEQNILRISDLKIEVGEHLITLEDQARAAREYLETQTRVRELDIGLSKRLLINIEEKSKKLAEDLARVKQESSAKKEAEEKDVNELLALKESQRRLEQEIDELQVRLDEEKDRLRDIELDRRFTAGELKREENALTSLGAKGTELLARIKELEQNLAEQGKKLDLDGVPLAEQLADVLQDAAKMIGQLALILACLGKAGALTLTLGGSAEKEETYKLKLEMLGEEQKRIAEDKEKASFAVQAHRAQLENLLSKVAAAQSKQQLLEQLSRKKQAKADLSNRIAELEEKIRNEDQVERRSLNEEATLEISLAKLEGELTGVRERISLEYSLSLEEIAASLQEVSNIAQAKKDIEEGRSKLRSLEPVNLLAIEEFEKEKERLSFIEAQLADLNSARENLRSLIIELDLRAEQTFLETMQRLSAIFSETFSKLFTGGEAKISLSPGSSALEAEIDISVRPSGRKWLPLPSLSGGERSLSAIAILFSLLKIRPSPFCFLDEVDAALDDANIGRFTDMLKDFSSESQIIVITHNKRTMAVADNIYGVTMEEPGVSKVISMKLTEAVA